MEYVVQAFKVMKNFVHVAANARAQKTGFFCHFPNPNTISLHDYQLILCMFGFLHELEHKICKLIPKGCSAIIAQMHLWELACKFHVLTRRLACSGVHSTCREENRRKVGIYVQLLRQGR